MCGISGIFGSRSSQHRLATMVARQHHRGPDADGQYISPSGNAALGHNRLSIIDLSPAGQQPMANADGSCRIVFNGEIYNYKELRRELSDYPYRSQSDTEVILAAYEKWGEDCVEHFIGMFALLIWDERRQMLFAARDRFGVK
ncbi:MAG TPA: asparagine synthetase B, partial [Blastocatellia bacterium]|nr:asparagine synthetase B [Blastocatellia bacterium]